MSDKSFADIIREVNNMTPEERRAAAVPTRANYGVRSELSEEEKAINNKARMIATKEKLKNTSAISPLGQLMKRTSGK